MTLGSLAGATGAARGRGLWRTLRNPQARAGYMFIFPGILLFLIFTVAPIGYAAYLSLTNYDIFAKRDLIWFENFARIVGDKVFLQSLVNTTYYALGTIPTSMAIAMLLAIIVNQGIRGRVFYRAAYYIPVITSTVAVSLIWLHIYDPSYGLLNFILEAVGLPRQRWLGDLNLALPSIIMMSIWRGLGFNMIIFLAGLQGIPQHLYEAAQIDGAGRFAIHRHITWPMLKPTTFFIFVISCIGAFQVFEQVLIMTNGGPANATTTVVHQIYQSAFVFFKMGYAAAQSFVLFAIILAMSLLNIRFFQGEVVY